MTNNKEIVIQIRDKETGEIVSQDSTQDWDVAVQMLYRMESVHGRLGDLEELPF